MTLMAIVAAALVWVQAHSPSLTPHYDDPVSVVVLEPEQLWYLSGTSVRYEDRDEEVLWGLHINGTVYLTSDCDYKLDTFCQSIIVHEIVHFLQEQSDNTYACVGKQEKEAYLIQRDWMEAQGKSLWDYIDPLYTISLFRCDGEFDGER